MSDQPSVQDRLDIQELLGRYVWLLDIGDVEGVVGLFTPDGAIQTGAGIRYEKAEGLRKFAIEDTTQANVRGRQHLVQPLYTRANKGGYTVRSYWMVVQWILSTNKMDIRRIGWSDDTCVKTPQGWRIKERMVMRWNDESQPWFDRLKE
jgi:hypothetical protein